MSLDAAIFPTIREAVVWLGSSLLWVREDGSATKLAEDEASVAFLSAGAVNRQFSFWLQADECFHVRDVTGLEVYTRRINTDRAAPHGICFSASGDGVVFVDDYDGVHRAVFHGLTESFTTKFGSSDSPFGFDAGLHRFASLARSDDGSEAELLVVDRHAELQTRLTWPYEVWRCIGLQPWAAGLAVLLGDDLLWFEDGEVGTPRAMQRLPRPFGHPHGIGDCSLRVAAGLALLLDGCGAAVVALRDAQRHESFDAVRKACLDDQGALILHENGTIRLLTGDLAEWVDWQVPEGERALAADLHGDQVRVLCVTRHTVDFCWHQIARPSKGC